MKILSVFVDESGKFQFPDNVSRFYIVTLVFHDQSISATELIAKLDSDWVTMGYENFCFHAGPRRFMRNVVKHLFKKEL